MLRPVLGSVAALACALLAACGGGGGGGGGSSGSATITLTPTGADFTGGSSVIQGTVTLPASVPANTFVNLRIHTNAMPYTNEVRSAFFSTGGSTVPYRITGLKAGSFRVYLSVDANDNDTVSDTSDYKGYYNGTTGARISSVTSAADVTVNGTNTVTADFGINSGTVSKPEAPVGSG